MLVINNWSPACNVFNNKSIIFESHFTYSSLDQHFLLSPQCFLLFPKQCFNFSDPFILSSANAFNLDQFKILSTGKELTECWWNHCQNAEVRKFISCLIVFIVIYHKIFKVSSTICNMFLLSICTYLQLTVNKQTYNNSPCSYGENVPASMLMYGSIFMDVTLTPEDLRIAPTLLAMTPFPMPLITPPVTRIYFIANRFRRPATFNYILPVKVIDMK